jgi:heat shock protein HtpX
VRIGPARSFTLISLTVAVGLPLAVIVALVALVEWSWMLVAVVLLAGCVGVLVNRRDDSPFESYYFETPPAAASLLERLCMRADMRAPKLLVEGDVVACAWTVGGRIHLSTRLLELLDDAELEAVLAHEVAHLARRDAAAMEACSAPSRLLLMFAGALGRNLGKITRRLFWELPRATIATWIVAVLCVPPAFVIGWISRLSVLGMSRAREFSADAAAAALTGRPSALASALLKLDRQREGAPSSDLRHAYPADPVLCIVGTHRSGVGRLFSTHPPTAARIRRLAEVEGRMQRERARL